VHDPLDGKAIRAMRESLGMTEMEFALLFGVTIRTVMLWETDVVVPSRITAMVIRAATERAQAEAAERSRSVPKTRSSRTRGRIATAGSPRSRRRA
jgi:DNA-binding XRE family transcriptional regulator